MPMQRLIAGMPQQLATTTSDLSPTSQQQPVGGTSNIQGNVSPERSKLSVQQGAGGAGRGPSPQPGGPPPQAPSRLQRRMQTQEDRDFQQMRQRYDEE